MQAVTFQGERSVAFQSVPEPELLGRDAAVVAVRSAGVCGSDLHVYFGRERGLDPGTPMGHEFVGEVIEAGGEVRGLAIGDLVVSPFTTSCGACFYCRRSLTARCTRGQLFGWVEDGVGLAGAQAERVAVPLAETTLVRVPSGLEADAALLAGDVLATGLFSADLCVIEPDSVVAVLGCGPVGLMATAAALEGEAGTVLAIDSVPERLALARQFGALAIDRRRQDPRAAVDDLTSGRGADAVLEAVGSPEATRLAVDLCRPGATIAAVGVHTESRFAFSPLEAYDKNLTYRAGRCSARSYLERALELLVSDRYPLPSVISHRLPLSEGPEAYQIFAEHRDGCTKAVLVP